MRRRLAIAATDRVDCPATYSRIVQDSAGCISAFFRGADFTADGFRTSFLAEALFFFIQQTCSKGQFLLFALWRLRQLAIDSAALGHRGTILDLFLFALVLRGHRFVYRNRLGFELRPQCLDLRLHSFALALELDEFDLALVGLANRSVAFLLLQCYPCRAREHPGRTEIDFDQPDSFRAQEELTNLIGMIHAARFQNVESTIALARKLDVAHQHPGVDERRNSEFRRFHFSAVFREHG